MKMHIAKAIVKIIALAALLWACAIGYALHDLKPKDYILTKGNVETLNEEIAIMLCGEVLIKEFNLQSSQIKPVPYQSLGTLLLAQNKNFKNEGSIIWYISSNEFDPTHIWHIQTKIIMREHDILISVTKPK